MQAKHSNIYNVLMGFILKGAQLLFPLVTFPYASRVLSVEGIGQVSFVQSTMNVFSLIAMLGIPYYGIIACSKCRDDKKRLKKVATEIIIVNFFAVIISYILLFALSISSQRIGAQKNLVIVFSLSILLTFLGMEWLFQALEEYSYITVRGVIGKIIAVVYLFIFVRGPDDAIHYAVSLVIGTVGSNIANTIRFIKQFSEVKIAEKLELKKHIKPIFAMFLFSAIASIYTSIDSTMLGYMRDDYQVGLYSAATKIKSVLIGVIGTVSSVLLSRTAYLIKIGDKKQVQGIMKNTMSFTLFLAIPCCFLCILMAEPILVILSGEQFIPATQALRFVTPAILFVSITNVVGVQYYIACGKERYLVVSNSMGALTDIILNLILIPRYGALGASFASASAEFLVATTLILCQRKEVVSFFETTEIIKFSFACILSTFVVMVVRTSSNSITSFFISGTLFLFSYLIILIVLRANIIREAIRLVRDASTHCQ